MLFIYNCIEGQKIFCPYYVIQGIIIFIYICITKYNAKTNTKH